MANEVISVDAISEEIEIRRALLVDAESILKLQYRCYESEARLYNDWSIPPLTETLEELKLEFSSQVFLKASIRGGIIGSVRAQVKDQSCEIGRLVVDPEFQRRGLGTRLMHEIERIFSAARRYELFTGSLSTSNIRLYESLGYRRVDSRVVTPTLTLTFMAKSNES
jgi:ribosomal protein S18 acetylase RimI-like enzyme